jgi:hypothetical protein
VCMYWKFDVLPEWIRPCHVGQRGGRTPALQNSWRFVFSCARRCAFLADLKRRSAIDRGSTLPQQPPTAVAAIIPYRPDFIAPQESLLRLSANSRRRRVPSRRKVPSLGERTNERPRRRRRMHTLYSFLSRLLGTGDDDARTNALCVYICRCSLAAPVSPSGGVGRQFVRRFHHHVFARRLADDIRVVRAGRPAVRSSVDRRG